tara:strand:- start:429 stop:704 length:276 start_codon:yes stop_codon:yes gene_type:complete
MHDIEIKRDKLPEGKLIVRLHGMTINGLSRAEGTLMGFSAELSIGQVVDGKFTSSKSITVGPHQLPKDFHDDLDSLAARMLPKVLELGGLD